MRFLLEPLLAADELRELVSVLQDPAAPWIDGASTAGWHARDLKRNHQLDGASPLHQQLSARLEAVLTAQPLLQAAAFPRRIHGLLFSRSGTGEGYGRHVDNAWMGGGRSDLSFSLFLSEPETYAGGAPGAGGPWWRGEFPPAGGPCPGLSLDPAAPGRAGDGR
jgi:PKHD-type hydroxylase